MADGKEPVEADPATKLGVDLMIFDYLIYSASRTGFEWRKRQANGADSAQAGYEMLKANVRLVDTFVKIFTATYPERELNPDLSLKLELLRFFLLFTRRLFYSPSSKPRQELREDNAIRTQQWFRRRWRSNNLTTRIPGLAQPLDPMDLRYFREAVFQRLGRTVSPFPNANECHNDKDFYGTEESMSLLDLLPLFMKVSALKAYNSGWTVSRAWMQQAAEFMLQAAVEQYLVFGASGSGPLQEAFAWGFNQDVRLPPPRSPGEPWSWCDSEDFILNELFRDEAGSSEIPEWTQVRQEYMDLMLLLPTIGSQGQQGPRRLEQLKELSVGHLMKISILHSLVEFEKNVVFFLESMFSILDLPVLRQLGPGQSDGLSRAETYALKDRISLLLLSSSS